MTLVSDILRDAAGALLTSTKLTFRRVAPLQGVDGDLVAPVFGTALAGSSTVTTHASTAAFSITLEPGVYAVSYQGPGGIETVTARVPTAGPVTLAGCIEQATTIDSSLADQAAESAAQAALYDGPWFDTFADLLVDTTLTYTSGTASSVAVGDWVRIRATGAAYQVMASSATTHDYATAGGVKVMDPSRRFASILSSDWQPETEEQVARLRAVLTEMAAFTASYDRQIVDLRILGDLVERPVQNDGTAILYGYPQLVTDLASRKLPTLRPLPGNHDMPFGDDDHPTNWSTIDYRRAFGAEFYAVRRGNMIDVYLGDMAGGTGGEQTDEALRWFEALLANARENNIIVHMHQPLYGTWGSSVVAYDADGFPADPTDIGTAYQSYSERIATAIEACPTVAAVFYGHLGTDYATSTQAVEQFGTIHIGVQMGLERPQRYADGGANDWADHYGVLDYTHGQTAMLFRRRDAKTGGWISGSDVAITLAYPANLRGDVHDGRAALDRINPTARGVLVVSGDMSDEREEVSPGVWEAVHGIRWRAQFATTEAALDNPDIGDGTGILLGIPGSTTDYVGGIESSSNNVATRPGGGWGGGIAAVRDRGTDGDLIGRLQFYVQNDVSGAVEDMVVVMESEGDRGTVRFLEGIEPRLLTNADTLAGLRVPDAKYSSTRGMAQLVSVGAIASAPADAPAQFVQGLHIQRDNDSASQLLMESGGGGVRLWLNSYTSAAWAGWGLIEALAARSFLSVTTATATLSGQHSIVTCSFAGTVTLTLPAAASFPGRQIRITTTTANAVISASSNVIPSLGGSAGTAILPAIAGASCWLVSNGTNWVEMFDVPYVSSATDETAGRVLLNGAGAAQAFRRANILGTVSQSGGVPTGAVIERGSGANGEYVRFADGTQICTVRIDLTATAMTTAVDALYRSSTATWTYPAAFAANPSVSGSIRRNGESYVMGHHLRSATTTASDYFVWSSSSIAGGSSKDLMLTAIGRWF